MGRAAKRKRRCKACDGSGLTVAEPSSVVRGTNWLGGPYVLTMSFERLCPRCTRAALLDGDWYAKPRLLR